MRAWLGRAVFVTILLGSFAAQERAAVSPEDGPGLLEPGILRVAGSHGLSLREYKTTNGVFSRTLVFDAPGCSQPVKVSQRVWTFEEEPLLERHPDPGYARRYVYIDRSWDRPDPRGVFIQRTKYRSLAMVGLTEYIPSTHLIVVETAKNCRAAEAIDWSPVWSRVSLSTARAGDGAAD